MPSRPQPFKFCTLATFQAKDSCFRHISKSTSTEHFGRRSRSPAFPLTPDCLICSSHSIHKQGAHRDASGNVSAQLGHYPFGESWYNASNDKLVFSTYERDSESGNDYAVARFNVSRLARFSSPDVLSGDTSNPQSFNRYVYSLNNPINLNDPFGLAPCNLTISLNGRSLDLLAEAQVKTIFAAGDITAIFVNGEGTVNLLKAQVDVQQYINLNHIGLGVLGYNPPGTFDAQVSNKAIAQVAVAVHGNYQLALGTVISHEIGHALGLPHESQGIMRAGTDQGTDAFFMNMGGAQNFTRSDINKIRQKLGCPPLKPTKKPKPGPGSGFNPICSTPIYGFLGGGPCPIGTNTCTGFLSAGCYGPGGFGGLGVGGFGCALEDASCGGASFNPRELRVTEEFMPNTGEPSWQLKIPFRMDEGVGVPSATSSDANTGSSNPAKSN